MSELPNDLRAKILIAEDDTIVALDLQGMVMRLGYDVVAIVDSGQAAIAAARRFLPDIILLDMVLNGSFDGIEVVREIHKTFDVPVVFCVSSPDLSILVRAKEISYAGYLLKPINPDSLATTLDTVLYKYKLEKRVQKAEERFRQLAEKCEILRFFQEQSAAFDWVWKPDSGITLTIPAERRDLPAEAISERLAAIASADFSGITAVSADGAGDSVNSVGLPGSFGIAPGGDELRQRLSTFIEVTGADGKIIRCAAIGLWDPAVAAVIGMLIPLSTIPS